MNINKKLLVGIGLVLTCHFASAQMINSSRNLSSKYFSLGFAPAYHIQGGEDGIMMNFYAGYGLQPDIDLGIRYGLGNTSYFGAQFEWALGKNMALITGGHNYHDFGFDGSFIFMIPLRYSSYIFLGADTDINFSNNGNISIPLWVPVGAEVALNSGISFIIEGDIAANDPAYHILLLGIGLRL
jgi:hypothetical protein